jgi:hypothetical protein
LITLLQSHRPRSFKAHYLLKRSRHYHAKAQIHVPKPTNERLETKRKRTNYGGRAILSDRPACCALSSVHRDLQVLLSVWWQAYSLMRLAFWSGPSGSPISPVHCTGASNWPIGPSHWPIGGPNTSRASHSLTPIGQLEGLRPPIRQ